MSRAWREALRGFECKLTSEGVDYVCTTCGMTIGHQARPHDSPALAVRLLNHTRNHLGEEPILEVRE